MTDVEKGIVLECPACGFDVPSVTRNGPHLEARCRTCKRYLKFVQKSEEWIAIAR